MQDTGQNVFVRALFTLQKNRHLDICSLLYLLPDLIYALTWALEMQRPGMPGMKMLEAGVLGLENLHLRMLSCIIEQAGSYLM